MNSAGPEHRQQSITSRPSAGCTGGPCRNWSTDRSTSPIADRCSTPNTMPSWPTAWVLEDPNTNIKPWLSAAHEQHRLAISPQTSVAFTVNSGSGVSGNVANITGSAPVAVKTIWFNGIEYPVTWTSVTTWRATVPLQPGTNLFNVVGVNRDNQPLPGASGIASAVYSPTPPSPLDRVVLNEIMFHPTAPGGQLVKLYNPPPTLLSTCQAGRCRGCLITLPRRVVARTQQLPHPGCRPHCLCRRFGPGFRYSILSPRLCPLRVKPWR